ncbi:hypothetical protein QQ045_022645 [Rhodiola kirilowii]
MAISQSSSLVPMFYACFSSSVAPHSVPTQLISLAASPRSWQQRDRIFCRRSRVCRAMVQEVVLGAPASYAKEMERLSAKESLLLALKDSGGFEALVTGKTTDMQKIDVNERIIGLERLNPTLRPTTSPYLEGRWNFEWFESGSPRSLAAKLIFESFPATVANLQKMDVLIKDGYAKITANTKLLNLGYLTAFLAMQIESKIILSTKLTVEGPLRLKEEYDEVFLESPRVDEGIIPDQLKGAFGQAVSTLQQLPGPIRDALSSGLTFPLNRSIQRMFMISYLDEEILIIRDTSGVPEVLTRFDAPPSSDAEPATEYES